MRGLRMAALATLALAGFGCKSNGIATDSTSNVSAQCIESKGSLAALCPAGTALDAHATVGESGACTGDTSAADGGIAGLCRVAGNCAIACKVVLDCACGAALISKEQVTCLECSTCGNGIKEAGEQCDQGEKNGSGNGCDKNCQTVAAACSPNGDLRCAPDLTAVQKCADGVWQADTKCTGDEQCDATTKLCATVQGYCATPGMGRCNGDYDREKCGADHRWADEPCSAQAPKCTLVGGAAECIAGDDVSVSANFRVPRSQLVIGGLLGHAESQAFKVDLGPVKR